MNTDLVYTSHKMAADQEPECTILPFPQLSQFNAQGNGLKSVSVVIPVFNEAENLAEMVAQTFAAMLATGRDFEVVFVDDGSTDATVEMLAGLVDEHSWLRSIHLAKNSGQTAALDAGLRSSTGDYVVTLDGDLQNDPADIPAMLQRLDAGNDIVFGWRKNRHDNWLRKKASQAANGLVRRVTGVVANDLGCTLKAMKRSVADRLELCGDMHRFIPVLASHLGARSCEVEVNHRPRTRGESKYGFERVPRVLQDLVTLAALKYRANPMRFFGGWGLRSFGLGSLASVALVGCILIGANVLVGCVLAAIAMLAAIVSVQMICFGTLAELQYRNVRFSEASQAAGIREQLGVPLKRQWRLSREMSGPKDEGFASFAVSQANDQAA